ncbi:MAG: hypothetical protein CL908_26995 [Deltaproteobacteria bacterium]|nr:hypothetical protein [Deltaproteobacteria bacterium]
MPAQTRNDLPSLYSGSLSKPEPKPKQAADGLCGPPVVVVEDSAQPFTTLDRAVQVEDALPLLDRPTVESLMIPFDGIGLGVFLRGAARRRGFSSKGMIWARHSDLA